MLDDASILLYNTVFSIADASWRDESPRDVSDRCLNLDIHMSEVWEGQGSYDFGNLWLYDKLAYWNIQWVISTSYLMLSDFPSWKLNL